MQKVLRTFVLVIGLAGATAADAQTRVEKNVIYGMYSGLALLMDVHYPAQPNGYGIVFVSGSGWQAPLNYGAVGLKEAANPPLGSTVASGRLHRVCDQPSRRASLSLSGGRG